MYNTVVHSASQSKHHGTTNEDCRSKFLVIFFLCNRHGVRVVNKRLSQQLCSDDTYVDPLVAGRRRHCGDRRRLLGARAARGRKWRHRLDLSDLSACSGCMHPTAPWVNVSLILVAMLMCPPRDVMRVGFLPALVYLGLVDGDTGLTNLFYAIGVTWLCMRLYGYAPSFTMHKPCMCLAGCPCCSCGSYELNWTMLAGLRP